MQLSKQKLRENETIQTKEAEEMAVTGLTSVKTAREIGILAEQLNPRGQFYVLNAINTLLASQQADKSESRKENP